MAKFITFNGITYVHPGAVSKVDVTALAQVSSSVTGIVALVGEAEGGQPNMVSAVGDPNFGIPKVYTFFDPATARATFREGPLADALNLAFDAANDPRIAAGASQVLAIKTNQSTAASVVLDTHYPPLTDACTVTSKDYGAHTGNIQIELDVSAADANNNEVTVTVQDNSTGITETLTNVAGKSLIDVQYRGPNTGRSLFTGFSLGPGAANQLTGDGTVFNGGTSVDADIGNWVKITSAPPGVNNWAFVGQTRRIANFVGGTVIEVESDWIDETDGSSVLPAGCGYEVIKECVGPFLAIDDTDGTTTYTAGALGSDTLVFHGFADNAGGGWPAAVQAQYVTGTAVSGWATTGVLRMGTNVGDGARYGDEDNGPCYIKIVSGPGAGQIRELTSGVAVVNNTLTIVTTGGTAWDDLGFSPAPTAASQFVFVNVSKDLTGAGSAPVANGALMSTAGTTGAATLLTLELRPGYGEWTTAGGGGPIIVNLAGVAAVTDFTVPIGTTTTVSDVINLINSPATPAISLSKQGWFARVGTGRVTTELASQLDWDGVVNTEVFACMGFEQIYKNTWGITSASVAVPQVPFKKNRLMDNLEQVIDTVNAQSALVGMTKATTLGSDGRGIPELNVPPIALAGGTAGTTTTTDLLNAYDVLIRHRHNTTVPLWSADGPSISLAEVHAATLSHTNLGSGAAKNENDAILAIDLATSANPLSDLQNSQAALNNRNCALVYEGVQRTNIDGTMTDFEPHMLAVILAGMQAGTSVGEPLTFKYLRSNDLFFPPALDPRDVTISNQLLLSGILFAEQVRGKGFRVVRNLSTYTQTDNLAYTDRNVNEVLNYVSYDLRSFIEDRFTGLKATPATAMSIKESVIAKLASYRDADIIVDSTDTVTGARINAFRNVRVTISGDIATIRFEMFPVIGINYEIIEIFAQLPTISA